MLAYIRMPGSKSKSSVPLLYNVCEYFTTPGWGHICYPPDRAGPRSLTVTDHINNALIQS